MPARDGTEPMGTRRSMGRQMVVCKRMAADICESRYGSGCRLHSRLRDGSCRFAVMGSDRTNLTAEKQILESRLKLVNEMLQSGKPNNSSDQSNA
jgi:hypothetical protein